MIFEIASVDREVCSACTESALIVKCLKIMRLEKIFAVKSPN